MDQTGDEKSKRFSDFNNQCKAWQSDADRVRKALYDLPIVAEKQLSLERDIKEINDKIDSKAGAANKALSRLISEIKIISERLSSKNKDLERLEKTLESHKEKVDAQEREISELAIDIARITANQNNIVSIAGKIVPYIALIISLFVNIYKVK